MKSKPNNSDECFKDGEGVYHHDYQEGIDHCLRCGKSRISTTNSDWQERFDDTFRNIVFDTTKGTTVSIKAFISSELQREREVKVKVVYNQVCEQIARDERLKTLKEVEGIIDDLTPDMCSGHEEAPFRFDYVNKDKLLSKINSLKNK